MEEEVAERALRTTEKTATWHENPQRIEPYEVRKAKIAHIIKNLCIFQGQKAKTDNKLVSSLSNFSNTRTFFPVERTFRKRWREHPSNF